PSGLEYFAAPRGDPLQLELRVIAVGDGTAFDRNKICGAVAQFLEGFVDVSVLDLDMLDLDFEVLLLSQLEFRQHLEGRAKLHWAGLGKIHLVDLRLRHRYHLIFAHRAFNLIGYQRLQYLGLDVFSESPADQRPRRLPGAESRHTRHARKFPRHSL